MTWFKVDDSFYRSRKVRKLGRDRVPAVGLWTLCGDWSADNLTDGFVPWEVVEDWDPGREWALRLLDVTLWFEAEVEGEKGVQFHGWADWQPTKDQVEQRRKADAERRARWREEKKARDAARAAQQGAKSSGLGSTSQCDNTRDAPRDATVTHLHDTTPDTADDDDDQGFLLSPPAESRHDSRRDAPRESWQASRPESALPVPSRPDPSRPVPLPSEETSSPRSRKKPAIRLPQIWQPTENHVGYATDHRLELDTQRQLFMAHADANDRRCANWNGAFTQWLIKADEIQRRQQNRPALRLASGGYTPYRNPEQSEYDEPAPWETT